jgi:integrase
VVQVLRTHKAHQAEGRLATDD